MAKTTLKSAPESLQFFGEYRQFANRLDKSTFSRTGKTSLDFGLSPTVKSENPLSMLFAQYMYVTPDLPPPFSSSKKA